MSRKAIFTREGQPIIFSVEQVELTFHDLPVGNLCLCVDEPRCAWVRSADAARDFFAETPLVHTFKTESGEQITVKNDRVLMIGGPYNGIYRYVDETETARIFPIATKSPEGGIDLDFPIFKKIIIEGEICFIHQSLSDEEAKEIYRKIKGAG